MSHASSQFEELIESARQLLSEFEAEEELLRANQCINAAIREAGASADAWLLKCQVMSALDDDAAALAAIEMVLALTPRSAEAHYWRAAVLADMGRPDDALAALDAALQHMTSIDEWLGEEIYCERAIALDAQGHWEEAVELFEEALRVYPHSALLKANLHPLLRQQVRRTLRVIQGGA